jgi:hypothetical protein
MCPDPPRLVVHPVSAILTRQSPHPDLATIATLPREPCPHQTRGHGPYPPLRIQLLSQCTGFQPEFVFGQRPNHVAEAYSCAVVHQSVRIETIDHSQELIGDEIWIFGR